MERILAALLIIFFTPLIILIVIGYIIAGESKFIFSQLRLGMNEVSFRLYKFRTLKDAMGDTIAERRFAFGNFLRMSSLDELPQLINVLKGEMSLVGPRPLPIEYQSLFSEEQKKRFLVKPGITGLAQINGGTSLSWDEKFVNDLEYVENQSFFGDIKIMLKTILVVFKRKDDGLNEKPFTGS